MVSGKAKHGDPQGVIVVEGGERFDRRCIMSGVKAFFFAALSTVILQTRPSVSVRTEPEGAASVTLVLL